MYRVVHPDRQCQLQSTVTVIIYVDGEGLVSEAVRKMTKFDRIDAF